MSVLDRIAAKRRGRKGWSESPFWSYPDDYPLPFLPTWGLKPDVEQIENDFEGFISGALKSDGIVYACIGTRLSIFAQSRFQWIEYTNGLPGAPFGTPELSLLERPWPGGTTGELLARMEIDASIAGNSYWTIADDAGRIGRSATGPGRRMVRMRPDWVTLHIGSKSGDPYALDAKVIAIRYEPKPRQLGDRKPAPPVLLLPNEVCHYSPIPDPEARFRGMSWLTPIIREIEADKAATKHKLKFFQNAATANLAVSLAKEITPEQFKMFVEEMDKQHKGVENAYKTLYTAGGADVTVIGADLKQLDFRSTQGAGETRIAAAAGVHPVIVALSEGMQGSSLNAGNFNAARRLSADKTFRYLWQVVAASLGNLLQAPSDRAELWADLRQVSFLQEDRKDQAEIQRTQAVAIRQLLDAGYDPDAAVRYIQQDDLSVLIGQHSGLYSVQLVPPGPGERASETDGAGSQ